MNRLKIRFEYGAYLFWEYEENGDFLDNFPSSRYQLPIKLVTELELLEEIYESTLNQEYPPDSKFSSSGEESDFNNRVKQAFSEIEYHLNSIYKLEF